MSGLSLYTIAAEYRGALEALDAIEGLDEQTVADTLDSVAGPLEDKVRAVAAFVKNTDAEAAAMKAAEVALAVRRKAREAKADRLRAYLLSCLDLAKKTSVAGIEFDVKVRKNPPSLVVTDEAKLKFAPADLFDTIPERTELNGARAKAALLAGTENDPEFRIAGLELRRGRRVEIK